MLSGARDVVRPVINLLRLRATPIFNQLHLEERLLRRSSDNWCIINDGSDSPAIVMGISGKPVELIELEPVLQDRIPVIRRFSGGGTVIVDGSTIFVTFICNKTAVHGVQPYPHPIMSWSGQFYAKVLDGVDGFHLCENDYVIGNQKIGGNAQSITKSRWVHHTSFLWDYENRNMAYLKLPTRTPKYRSARDHDEFLCRIKDHMSSRSDFIENIISTCAENFIVKPVQLEEAIETSDTSQYPWSTKLITTQDLQCAFESQSDTIRSQYIELC